MTDASNEQGKGIGNASVKQQSTYGDDINLLSSSNNDFNSLLKTFFDEPLFLSLTPHFISNDEDDINGTGSSSSSSSNTLPIVTSTTTSTSSSSADLLSSTSNSTTQTSPSNIQPSSTSLSLLDQTIHDTTKDDCLSPSTSSASVAAASGTIKANKRKRQSGVSFVSIIKERDKLGFKEEVQKLKSENIKLREEISSLRDKLHKLPMGQDSDLIENALLKNSLLEYKKFIQNCMSLSIPSERVALRSIGRQGADFAMNHLLNTLASSQNGKDWKPILKSQHTFTFFNIGVDFTMCYRTRVDEKGRKVMDVRIDFVAPKVCFVIFYFVLK